MKYGKQLPACELLSVSAGASIAQQLCADSYVLTTTQPKTSLLHCRAFRNSAPGYSALMVVEVEW